MKTTKSILKEMGLDPDQSLESSIQEGMAFIEKELPLFEVVDQVISSQSPHKEAELLKQLKDIPYTDEQIEAQALNVESILRSGRHPMPGVYAVIARNHVRNELIELNERLKDELEKLEKKASA